VFALRFEVYCVECNFLPGEDYPDGLERGRIRRRIGPLLRIRRQSIARRLRPARATDTVDCFPFQHHCKMLDPSVRLPNPGESAEISRLMVHSSFRRRRTDGMPGLLSDHDPAPLPGERRSNSPQVVARPVPADVRLQCRPRHPLLVRRDGALAGARAEPS
jgi:N-acyl amino acid synthase of PEP-CTERM/exosortase system